MDIDRIVRVRESGGGRINKLFGPGRPVIIVFHEDPHDGTLDPLVRRISCRNRGELECACLATLWDRFHDGYYDHFPAPEPAVPPISKDAVDAMPDGETKRGATEEWGQYEVALSWRKKSTEQMETVGAALQGRDGTLAFAVLRGGSDDEHEDFEAESSGAIDNLPKVDLLSISRLAAR